MKLPILLRIFQILTSCTAVFAVLHIIYTIVDYYYGNTLTALPLTGHIAFTVVFWGVIIVIGIVICVIISKHIKK